MDLKAAHKSYPRFWVGSWGLAQMHTSTVTPQEVLAISSRIEDHFYERKAVAVSGKKIQKAVVAFANADGGELILGVSDDAAEPNPENRWVGAQSIERLNGALQCIQEVTPPIDQRYDFLKCPDRPGYVLRVRVEKDAEVHQTSDGTVYVRHGAQSLPVKNAQRIAELAFAKGAASFEDNTVNDVRPEAVVDADELRSFLESYSPATDPLDFAVSQNLLHPTSWQPRIASLLLFHQNPSTVIPRKCAVKISRYETKEDEPERDHLAEQVTLEGPLHTLIRAAIDNIKRIMSSVQIWTAQGLKYAEYPPEAIWEVVVNSLIHRDYSISDDVQILIYDNRIEVVSPGRLPGYVTPENILEARIFQESQDRPDPELLPKCTQQGHG